MFHRSWLAGQVVVFLASLWWSWSIFSRRHEDLETLRLSREPADKFVVLFYWLTAVAALGLAVVNGVSIAKFVSNFASW